MNAPLIAGRPPTSSPAADCLPGRRAPDPRDVQRATETVDAALQGASPFYIARNRELMIRNELKFARFEREQHEWRRRHGLRAVGR